MPYYFVIEHRHVTHPELLILHRLEQSYQLHHQCHLE